ncbi:MAG: extracellular solute-binding protein, partial [Pseudomonadota bacterium]
MTKARALAMRQTSGALAHRLFAATTLAVVLAAAFIVTQARGDGHTTTSHGISAFGDLKYPADFPHFDYVNPDAPKGGTFSSRGTGASNTFDSLNAYILKGEPAQGLGLLYDTLLVGSADEPDSAYGLIAESLEYPEDRSWVTFNMREEAQFSDGTPLTSADVVWTFNTLIEKGVPSFKIRYQDVESVEALGPHQVKFTFKSDAVSFRDLPATMGGMPILPMHYYAERDFAESTMEFPVGSGAYVVDEAQPGRMIRYCRNPDYWGADLPVNVGTYNFECTVYEYFADRTAAFEALKSGTYLFHEEFYSKIWATEYNFPSLEKGWVIQESIPEARPSGTQGYWINTRREKFADPRVREAIGKLFNFEWSNETLFYGIYDRTDSFWENAQNMQATGMAEGKERAILEEFRDLLPASVLEAEAFTPGIYPPARVPRSAIRAAKRLMEEAGYSLQNG